MTSLARDARAIEDGARQYGPSWKQRGGAGAYMVAIRKWDRIRVQLARHDDNWEDAIAADQRAEGIMDDVRDLRCYLQMILAEVEYQTRMHQVGMVPLGYIGYLPVVQERIGEATADAWSPDALIRALGELESTTKAHEWDVFRAINITSVAWNAAYVAAQQLFAVDARYGAGIGDVVKGDEEVVTLVFLHGGDQVVLRAEDFEHVLSRWEAATPEGYPVVLAPGAVTAAIRLPASALPPQYPASAGFNPE